jgi:hypothetical protein
MKILSYVLIVLSLIVLGAHFLRYGNMLGVLGALVLIGMLFVRQAWVARLIQVILVLGALEWVRTLFVMARWRAAQGEPFVRMVVILGIVAAVTLCSALLFQLPALNRIYGLGSSRK